MLQPFSQTEQALRDTLINKAEVAAFDDLARMYGWPRPQVFAIKEWRQGLGAIALGPRGTPGITHAAIEAIFDNLELAWTVDLAAANPQRATWASGPEVAFDKSHMGRLVRIYSSIDGTGGRLYFTEGPDLVGGGTSPFVNLVAVETAQWKGADWTALPGAETGVVMRMMPWLYRDGSLPCLFEMLVAEALWKAPPTYFFADGQDPPNAHPGPPRPFGGYIQANAFSEGNQTTGPYPPYLGGGTAPGIADLIDMLLAAGVRVIAKQIDFADAYKDG